MPEHRSSWKWWICGLLLLATMINYMDRLTLNLTAARIKDEFRIDNTQYGQIEGAFAIAFALGALVTGWAADRINVRWMYPAVLLGWSAAGFLTGFAQTFVALVAFRFLLGLFEAGNWPCALQTTQRLLSPGERTMGNGVLQSGAAVGSVVTPLIVAALVSGPGTWSYPFFVVGALGLVWVVLWLACIRPDDFGTAGRMAMIADPTDDARGFWPVFRDRRFWTAVIVVIANNATWHFFRAWLPLFLKEAHGYDERDVYFITAGYYVATDLGSLSAGFGTLLLARRGVSVQGSRIIVYAAAALCTVASLAAAALPRGPLLVAAVFVVGFGALALFPVYYALSQEFSVRHQGKVVGTLAFSTWVAMAVMQPLVGLWVDRTHDYKTAVALSCLPPAVGLAALLLWWRPVRWFHPAAAPSPADVLAKP